MKIDYKTVALLVAVGLVVVLVIATVGAIVLASQDKDLPSSIASRLDAILVGLLGLLAKSPTADEVTVVNDDDRPVPTTEAGWSTGDVILLVAAGFGLLVLALVGLGVLDFHTN